MQAYRTLFIRIISSDKVMDKKRRGTYAEFLGAASAE